MQRISMLLAAAVIPAAMAADSIEVRTRQLGPDRYELAMDLPARLDPRQASSMLLPVAEELCAGRPAGFERYRFESNAPLGADAGAATQAFTQEVACGASNAIVHVARAPKTPPTAQDEQRIRADTLRYLAAKDRDDFDAAKSLLGPELTELFANGKSRDARVAFNAKAGLPNRREVVRLTWYDDPAGAPLPGRYVAADYRGDYAHAGFYCGYVVWHLQPDGSFRIVREEEAQMPDEITKTMSAEELASARAQVQCRD
jgi:hypothetical protein